MSELFSLNLDPNSGTLISTPSNFYKTAFNPVTITNQAGKIPATFHLTVQPTLNQVKVNQSYRMSNQTMLLRQHHQLSGIRGVNQPLSRRRQPPDAVDSTVAVLFQFANHGQPVARLVLLVDLEDARHYPSVTGYYAAGQTDNEVATEGRQRNRNRVLFE